MAGLMPFKKQVKPCRLDEELPKGGWAYVHHHHEARLGMRIIFMFNLSILEASRGQGMVPMGTFLSPASALSVVDVWDLHDEVRLDMGIIFMYIMSIWGGSWGSGCCRRARFRRRRRRRRS